MATKREARAEDEDEEAAFLYGDGHDGGQHGDVVHTTAEGATAPTGAGSTATAATAAADGKAGGDTAGKQGTCAIPRPHSLTSSRIRALVWTSDDTRPWTADAAKNGGEDDEEEEDEDDEDEDDASDEVRTTPSPGRPVPDERLCRLTWRFLCTGRKTRTSRL